MGRSEGMGNVSEWVASLAARASMDPNYGGVPPIQVLPDGALASSEREHERPQPILSIGAARSGRVRREVVRLSADEAMGIALRDDVLPSMLAASLPCLAPSLPCIEGTQSLSSPLTHQ